MIKRSSIIIFFIFCSLVTQAQDDPASWDSDPLDVLEAQSIEDEISESTKSEFQEIPESGEISAESKDASTPTPAAPAADAPSEQTVDVPATEIIESTPAPEELAPAPLEQAESVPAPSEETGFSTSENAAASTDGDPDFNREAEFHRIYKTYNEQPTSEEVWEKAVSSRESQKYVIQKGDTLSDISTTFFSDPLYWPKIWSLNKDRIGNPHRISPGLNIQFFPGSLLDAPTLAVAENGADPNGTANDGSTAPSVPSLAGAVIPPPKARTPLLKKLPSSLPGYAIGGSEEERQEMIVDLKPTVFPNATQQLEYFVSESKVPAAGKVTAAELGVNSAGNFQYIYVEVDGTPEKNYVVQAYRNPIEDPKTSRDVQMIEVQGQIEVLEKVNEKKNVYRAMVTRALHPVRVGSFLTPGELPIVDPKIGSLTRSVKANIIGGAYDNNRKLLMLHSYVFLDRGTGQGVEVGQSLPIFANEDLRNNSDAKINDRNIGIVKVVKVTPQYATGYIVRAKEDIRTGDYVGGRPVMGSDAVSSSASAAPTEEFELDLEEPASEAPAPDSGSSTDEFDF